MKRPIYALTLAALLAFGLTGCDAVTTSAEDGAELAPDAATAASRAAVSTSLVYTWPPETATVVDGAEAELTRTRNGVNFRLATHSLNPGHAYTLWLVVFNDPGECLDGFCDPADLFNPAANPDMVYGTGLVVGGSGRATFAGRLRVGDASGSVQAPLGFAPNGLMDPYEAEIHFVVHDHGPKLPAFMPGMIQTIAGGCTDTGVPAAGVPSPWNDYDGPEYGERGPNTCASAQFAVLAP